MKELVDKTVLCQKEVTNKKDGLLTNNDRKQGEGKRQLCLRSSRNLQNRYTGRRYIGSGNGIKHRS